MSDHTFITGDDLFKYLLAWGWIFPLAIIATFLVLYRLAILRKIKDEIKKRKELTNIEHRSNGHHKKKEKV